MKLTMKRNKRRHTATFRFTAETAGDGVALKDAVLAAAKGEGFHPARIIEQLGKAGYTADEPIGAVIHLREAQGRLEL